MKIRIILTIIISIFFINNSFALPFVSIETNFGNITLELYSDTAPISTSNFLQYVDTGFYDGTVFHRVIENFMIQGGGYSKNYFEKITKSPIKNEATNGISNTRGTISMARTSSINSATSQFFINLSNNTFLDHKSKSSRDYGYAVFGRVISGMDVVDKIGGLPTGHKKGMSDVPTDLVVIKSVKRVNKND